jgi:hypothetical protein
MKTGQRIALVQVDSDQFIGLVPTGGRESCLVAFPRQSRSGKPIGWVTEQNELVFAANVRSTAGQFTWRGDEQWDVLGRETDRCLVRWKRDGRWIKAWAPRSPVDPGTAGGEEPTASLESNVREEPPPPANTGDEVADIQTGSAAAAPADMPSASASSQHSASQNPVDPGWVTHWTLAPPQTLADSLSKLWNGHTETPAGAGRVSKQVDPLSDLSQIMLAGLSGAGTIAFGMALVAIQRRRNAMRSKASTAALSKREAVKQDAARYLDTVGSVIMMEEPSKGLPMESPVEAYGKLRTSVAGNEERLGSSDALTGFADRTLLLSVVQMLHHGRKTGDLCVVDCVSGGASRLMMSEGEIVDVMSQGKSGPEAMTAFFDQQRVEFSFHPDAVGTTTSKFKEGTMELLLRFSMSAL